MKKRDFFKEKRRWSVFKDKLLEKYLPIYFSKILMTNRNTIYIDGFAGVGKFDDGTDGSPIIVSNTIQHAQNITKGKSKIIAYFIEYEYAEELRKNLKGKNVISGDFKIEVPKIIDSLNGDNVFLYADPFGIKHLKFDIINKLKNENINSSELLLNFNAFGFLREGCRLLKIEQDDIGKEYDVEEDKSNGPNSIDNMNSIANGDYWQKILNEYNSKLISMKEAEKNFVNQYINQLRGVFKFIISIPIRTGEQNIPKYHMIFGTNYIDGLLLMADAMLFCDNEIQAINNNNQQSLFDYLDKFNMDDDILNCLTNQFLPIKQACLMIYQKAGVKYSHKEIQKALKRLEKEKKIIVKRKPEFTRTHQVAKALSIMGKDYEIEVKKVE